VCVPFILESPAIPGFLQPTFESASGLPQPCLKQSGRGFPYICFHMWSEQIPGFTIYILRRPSESLFRDIRPQLITRKVNFANFHKPLAGPSCSWRAWTPSYTIMIY
jgi:hypothetical protein